MTSFSVRFHRVLRAPADRIFRAFTQPEAMAKWLPPHGFTARVERMDARVGGQWRMAFISIATGHSHAFGGEYLELLPGERLRYTSRFDDPNLPGDMCTTVDLRTMGSATELAVVQEGIPAVIPAEACHLGWQQSLQLLAQLVEAETGE